MGKKVVEGRGRGGKDLARGRSRKMKEKRRDHDPREGLRRGGIRRRNEGSTTTIGVSTPKTTALFSFDDEGEGRRDCDDDDDEEG